MVPGKRPNISGNEFYIFRFYLPFKMLLPVILFAILKIDFSIGMLL